MSILRRGSVLHVLTRLARAYLQVRSLLPHKPGIDALDAVKVINLAERVDRWAAFSAQADQLGLPAVRFSAIRRTPGIVGCTLSHAAVLREMIESGWSAMMICEDDAVFRVSRRELDLLVSSFLADREAEIACIGFNLLSKPHPRNLLYVRAFETQTTSCYVVKASIAGDLATLFEQGAAEMMAGGDRMVHGLDMAWKQLQPYRVFVVPTFRAVVQASGWSDVEDAHITYGV